MWEKRGEKITKSKIEEIETAKIETAEIEECLYNLSSFFTDFLFKSALNVLCSSGQELFFPFLSDLISFDICSLM